MNALETGLGLYCHIPFCASTCDFCAFYQEKPRRKDLDRYLEGMETELRRTQPNRPIDTVFWGGGTPGLLPAADLARLGKATLAITGRQPIEWTVEMAPSTVKNDKLRVLKDLGVNRISMGVQSFQESFLEGLGRLHRKNQIYQAYDRIRAVGFDNVNLDLMIALPGQGEGDLIKDLTEACRLAPEHLSTYCLTFEEDTALWIKLSQGKIKQDLESDADLYELTWRFLEAAGYKHYEISNFSRPGFECVHNMNTWKMKEWIGVGPSAASQYRMVRYSNTADLEGWLKQLGAKLADREEVKLLTTEDLLVDSVIFGLRMGRGVSIKRLAQRFSLKRDQSLVSFFTMLAENGLATFDNHNRAALTLKGKLLVDRIALEFLDWVENNSSLTE